MGISRRKNTKNGGNPFPFIDRILRHDVLTYPLIDGIKLEPGVVLPEYTRLNNLNLTNINLNGSILNRVIFENVNLTGAILNNSLFRWAEFTNCDLIGADLSFCALEYSRFTNCKFNNANLTNANFMNSNMEDLDFSHTNLTGANMTRSYFYNRINFNNANLSNAIMRGIENRRPNIVSDITFVRANLYKTDFSSIKAVNDMTPDDIADEIMKKMSKSWQFPDMSSIVINLGYILDPEFMEPLESGFGYRFDFTDLFREKGFDGNVLLAENENSNNDKTLFENRLREILDLFVVYKSNFKKRVDTGSLVLNKYHNWEKQFGADQSKIIMSHISIILLDLCNNKTTRFTDLRNCNFDYANLDETNFRGVWSNFNTNLTNALNFKNIKTGEIFGFIRLPFMYQYFNNHIFGKGVDIHGIDLSDYDLSDYDSRYFENISSGCVITNINTVLPIGYRVVQGYIVGPKVNLSNAFNMERSLDLSSLDLTGVKINIPYVIETLILPNSMYRQINGRYTHHLIGPSLNCSNMDLIGANLKDAHLLDTNLSNSNLTDADLSGATLIQTNLSSSNLTDANLSGATLVRTNLRNSDLTNVIFDKSIIRDIDFTDTIMNPDDIIKNALEITDTVGLSDDREEFFGSTDSYGGAYKRKNRQSRRKKRNTIVKSRRT